MPEQIASLLAITGGTLDQVPIGRIGNTETALREATVAQDADLCGRIESGDKLTQDDRKTLLDTACKATETMREETSHAND